MSESNARIVVITGCSSGIGLATALLFARDPEKRFKVYATMRNLEKREDLVKDGEKLLGATLFLQKLDVSDAASINQFVDEILEKEGRIDVLVNNAGVGRFGPLEDHSLGHMQSIFTSNCYGPMLLMKRLLPHWKKHNYGHVISVSSIAGIAAFPFSAVYNASKFALEGFFESMALECMNFTGIKVSLMQPGPVVTKFGQNNGIERIIGLYENLDQVTSETMKKMFENIRKMFENNVEMPEDIAKVILEAATSDKPHLRYSTNRYFDEMLLKKYADLDGDEGLKAAIEMFHG